MTKHGRNMLHSLQFLRRNSLRSFWTRTGLQTKMSLLAVVMMIALISVFGLLTVTVARGATDRALQERVVLAQLAATDMDYVLSNAHTLLYVTAAHQANVPDAARQDDLHQVMTLANSPFRQLWLTDRTGRVIASALPETTTLSFSDIAQALQEKPFLIATTTLSGSDNMVITAVPVQDASGQATGALVARLNMTGSELYGVVQTINLGQTGYLDVVDENGLIILSTQPERRWTQADHRDSLASLIHSGKSSASTCHSCHGVAVDEERQLEVMAFAPLQNAPWGVVIHQAQEEAFAPYLGLERRILLLGLLSVIGAAILTWVVTRSFIIPVRSLTAATQRIASGDLETSIAVTSGDEIGVLAHTLDDMRARLQASIAEIHDLNRDLDERVQERTLECTSAQDALMRRNRELSALNAVAMAITQPLRLNELLGTALGEVLRVTGVDAGSIFILREETGELELQAQCGASEEAAQAMIRLHLDDSACGGVARKDHPMIVPDLTRSRAGAGLALRQAGIHSLVHVPLISRGMTLGTLCVGTQCPRDFQPEEVDLLMAIGSQIAVGLENARLYEELAHREQLRGELLEKVIAAQEEERKRIARDLHDDTSQSLSALIYALEAAETRCDLAEVRGSLVSMRQLVTQTLEGIHKLIFDLRPSMLDHLGLFVALRWYAETHLEPAGMRLHLEEKGSLQRLSPQTETALFRVVQEAVNNIARHSGARNVRLAFDGRDGVVRIDVEDDGIGFDLADVAHSTDRRRGLGLAGMQERVGLLGGQINIMSTLGAGTHISIQVPRKGS